MLSSHWEKNKQKLQGFLLKILKEVYILDPENYKKSDSKNYMLIVNLYILVPNVLFWQNTWIRCSLVPCSENAYDNLWYVWCYSSPKNFSHWTVLFNFS